MAWHGRTILEALAGGFKLTRELAEITGAGDLKSCLRALRGRGLVASCEGLHSITDAGRDALARKLKLNSGPCSGKAASRKTRTLRDKAWSAMRQRDFFGVDDLLLLLVSEGDCEKARRNLQGYCTALEFAGYLARKAGQGPRRYRLRRERDTGPLAPAWNKAARTVTDANTGERYAASRRGLC